jgi:SAM-dependent methyltransferase
MTPETTRALCAITERFYRTRADAFAGKRDRAWPGMRRVLDELPEPPARVLDAGCAHGRFAALLAERHPGVAYHGVDASAELLAIGAARRDIPAAARWDRLDLIFSSDTLPAGPFDLVSMFAVIHHVPGEARRRSLVETMASRVAPGGTLAVAFWRTSGDQPRRHVDWSSVGIDPAELEAGDRLQTFDSDGSVPRYAHFADDAEIERMQTACDLPLVLRFDSDGDGLLSNAYLLWQRPLE